MTPLEGRAESAFGFVAKREGNRRDGIAGVRQICLRPASCASACRCSMRDFPTVSLRFRRKSDRRLAHAFRQRLQGPALGQRPMYGLNRGAHLPSASAKNRPSAARTLRPDAAAALPDQHHVGPNCSCQRSCTAAALAAPASYAPEEPAPSACLVRFYCGYGGWAAVNPNRITA